MSDTTTPTPLTPDTYTPQQDASGTVTGYIRASDSAWVPVDAGNMDYRRFLAQQAAGLATINPSA